jgi:AcrR family transcriptional regulator
MLCQQLVTYFSLDDSPAMKPTRRRDAAATRAALLAAARRRFAEQGYDNCGMREIASEAGVDAALVSRYFGCKEELFGEALSCSGDPDRLIQGDPADFGARVAHELVYEPTDGDKFEGLLIILRSLTSPRACEIAQRSGRERFLEPFAQWLGGPDARVRARLALSVIMGMALSRAVNDDAEWSAEEKALLCTRAAELLQAAATGAIPSRAS